MSLMDWNEKLSVGVQAIDDDHKKLVAMVNEMHDALRQSKGKQALEKILAGLIDYTKVHFAREEAEMARTKYPRAQDHIKEHVTLTQQVLDIQRKYQAGHVAVLSMEVMAFLRDWLTKHIMGSDKALGTYLQTQKLKRSA